MRLFCLLIALSACASATPSGPCAKRVGVYTSTYTERSGGTCGAIASASVSLTQQPPAGQVMGMLGPGISYSADNCVVTADSRTSDEKERLEQTTTWDETATRGIGTLKLTRFGQTIGSGAREVLCVSTYDVVIVRQ